VRRAKQSPTVFECDVLARRRFNLLGIINSWEGIPMKNLANRLLDLIKGTNFFTQEWNNVQKHNKHNGCSVRDEKDRLYVITLQSTIRLISKVLRPVHRSQCCPKPRSQVLVQARGVSIYLYSFSLLYWSAAQSANCPLTTEVLELNDSFMLCSIRFSWTVSFEWVDITKLSWREHKLTVWYSSVSSLLLGSVTYSGNLFP
jgi:hypothetical protein